MNSPMIECLNVKKGFGKRNILNGLSLSVPKGSVLGLLGKNGAGKTTLIKLLVGLLKADSGSISVLGESPWRFSEGAKERFGYVPQREKLYPWLTVRQLIEYAGSFYRHWNETLVEQLIRQWRLNEQERIGVLSEGEAQKVAIILALAHEPELLILDEPVASLDPLARREFLKTILHSVADRQCTVFFSTHITSDLERAADHVVLINEGAVSFCGELDELKEQVKRVRIMAGDVTVEQLQMKGVLACEHTDGGVVLTLKDQQGDALQKLEQQFGQAMHVENLNLEEIFLELSR